MQKQKAQTAVESEKPKQKEYEIIEETFDDISEGDFESSGLGDYDDIYYVKPKTKDCAYFEFSKKKGNTISKDPRTTITSIDGEVKKIELGSYTYEKKEVKTIKIHLAKTIKDKKILFMLSSSFTQVGRSIINSLLNCKEPIEKLTLGLYINNSGFTSVKTLINGKKADWKFPIEMQKPYIEEVKNKKGDVTMRDYTELDDLFETELQNHLSVLLPNQDHRKITSDIPQEPTDEVIFGDDADGFFNIDENEEK